MGLECGSRVTVSHEVEYEIYSNSGARCEFCGLSRDVMGSSEDLNSSSKYSKENFED